MRILGLSVFCDASAALIENNRIICAVEEERLNRIKHYEGFPWLAIDECLDVANLTMNDIDIIAIGWNPYIGWPNRIAASLKSLMNSYKLFLLKMKRGTGYLNRCKELFSIRSVLSRKYCEEIKQKIFFINHHLSHAASAFLLSPWQEVNAIVADGIGESATISFYHCVGNVITKTKTIKFPHSLGHVYASVTKFLGFRMCYDEGKVMALASFGRNTYADLFSDLIEINEKKGDIKVGNVILDYHAARHGLFSERWLKLTELTPRQNGAPLTHKHKDLACSLQRRIEEAVLSLLKSNIVSPNTPLCAAGGLFLNVVLNGRVLREFNHNYFVQPAAGDNGVSIGSALYVASRQLPSFKKSKLSHIYFGRNYTDQQTIKCLKNAPNRYYLSNNIYAETAEFIAQGKIVGWYQGGMEFGSRALGNRSILANPLKGDMTEIINSKVKHREPFRPFAGSVILEEGHKYFEHFQESPYMLKVFYFRKRFRNKFTAITHVDHSCRVQTVSRTNKVYYALLQEIRKKLGFGVVLNTSLNVKGEPIVNTPQEAINLLNSTELDILILRNYVVFKI